jgi:cation diffusion facilitator family transporter
MFMKTDSAAAGNPAMVNYSKGESITKVCLWGNLVLCILKFIAGVFGRSQAMVADALHSGSDVIATFAVLIGIRIAQRPVDEKYHFGYGKIEPIMSTFVGITLVFAAYEISKSIVVSIIQDSFATPSILALAAAIISIAVKEFMYRMTMKVGVELNSESIKANAWDHRSDAYSSIGTFVGIGGAMLGGSLGIEWLRYLDPLAGMIVAVLIFKVALHILWQALRSLMDAAPDHETTEQIHSVVGQFDEVRQIPWLKARYSGPLLWLDLAIRMDANMPILEAHEIGQKVAAAIKEQVSNVDRVIVHFDACTCQQGNGDLNHSNGSLNSCRLKQQILS